MRRETIITDYWETDHNDFSLSLQVFNVPVTPPVDTNGADGFDQEYISWYFRNISRSESNDQESSFKSDTVKKENYKI